MNKVRTGRRVTCFVAAIMIGALPAQSAKAADSVSLITDFGYNGRHAYFFVALDKGYYKDAGLDVKIIGGSGSGGAIPPGRPGEPNLCLPDGRPLNLFPAQ